MNTIDDFKLRLMCDRADAMNVQGNANATMKILLRTRPRRRSYRAAAGAGVSGAVNENLLKELVISRAADDAINEAVDAITYHDAHRVTDNCPTTTFRNMITAAMVRCRISKTFEISQTHDDATNEVCGVDCKQTSHTHCAFRKMIDPKTERKHTNKFLTRVEGVLGRIVEIVLYKAALVAATTTIKEGDIRAAFHLAFPHARQMEKREEGLGGVHDILLQNSTGIVRDMFERIPDDRVSLHTLNAAVFKGIGMYPSREKTLGTLTCTSFKKQSGVYHWQDPLCGSSCIIHALPNSVKVVCGGQKVNRGHARQCPRPLTTKYKVDKTSTSTVCTNCKNPRGNHINTLREVGHCTGGGACTAKIKQGECEASSHCTWEPVCDIQDVNSKTIGHMRCSSTKLVTSYYLPAAADEVVWNSKMIIKTDKPRKTPSYILADDSEMEQPRLDFELGAAPPTWPPEDLTMHSNANIF